MSAETSTDDDDSLHELRGLFLRAVAPELQGEGLGPGELLEEVHHAGFGVAVAALPLDLHDPLEVEVELYRTCGQNKLNAHLFGEERVDVGFEDQWIGHELAFCKSFAGQTQR
jgi:hypothetical protein